MGIPLVLLRPFPCCHENKKQGLNDPKQLEYATEHNRIILTDNRKDFLKLHNQGVEHTGIYSYKPNSLSIEQATARTLYVSEHVSDMQNTHVRINQGDWMIERRGQERETYQYSAEFRKQEYLDREEQAREEQELDSNLQTKDIERS